MCMEIKRCGKVEGENKRCGRRMRDVKDGRYLQRDNERKEQTRTERLKDAKRGSRVCLEPAKCEVGEMRRNVWWTKPVKQEWMQLQRVEVYEIK